MWDFAPRSDCCEAIAGRRLRLFLPSVSKERGILMNHSEPIRNARAGNSQNADFGSQHMFAMFGATVLVPILVQKLRFAPVHSNDPAVCRHWNSVFSRLHQAEGACFLGSSFAYLGGFQAVAKNSGMYANMTGGKAALCIGRYCCVGLLYVVLAAVIKLVGVKKVMRFLPPVVTGPIIILIGLNLAPSAVSMPPPAGGWLW